MQHTEEYGRRQLQHCFYRDTINEDDYDEKSFGEGAVWEEERDLKEEYRHFARMKTLCKERNHAMQGQEEASSKKAGKNEEK